MDLAKELEFLRKNPWFEERPASIMEFCYDEQYLNIGKHLRKSIAAELENIFGSEPNPDRLALYQLAMFTGGIGIGKTTIASVVMPYMAHWVLCLSDPQDYFNFLAGSRIAFMQMSTSEGQAKEVVFGDIKARINYSPWFQEKYPYDPNFKNQLRFPKDIWILPGDSAETTFEGYNILGGILDEADSHKITKQKDYAEQGYTTIYSRITSRFEDQGFMLVIGQMKKANGFAARKFKEFKTNPRAYVCRMAIWESFGWDHYTNDKGERESFYYDAKRKEVIPKEVASEVTNANLIEVPLMFLDDFMNNPEKALRDLAGIPPAVGDPFISLTYKIDDARDRYKARLGVETPYVDGRGFEKWFKAPDALKRVGHIDMAFSGEGDALGFAMGHVHHMVETEDGETKPYIVIDCLVRLQAPAGQEIFIGDVRRMIYDLKDNRRFKIVRVTMDGFQSTDTRQQLVRRRIDSEHISMDKSLIPYYDLREAIYEDRIEFPEYYVVYRRGETEKVEILVKELTELEDNGDKIDHPSEGSKDVADAVAGVVYTLMGDRTYHRRVLQMGPKQAQPKSQRRSAALSESLPATAPIPPRNGFSTPIWNPKGATKR